MATKNKSDTTPNFYDALASFELGVNSGVEPILLPKNQLAWSINATMRGGYISTRPPLNRQTINYGGDAALQSLVETGLFQGAEIYRPDSSVSQIIASISGHIIAFTPTGNQTWSVTDISVAGDLNDPTIPIVWMWQSERWMIISDGTAAFPIFYDGASSRRSLGPSTLLAVANAFAPVAPPTIGANVQVTLTAPWTGPFNVPVIMNGEQYMPVAVPAGTANTTFNNLFVTAGLPIAAGASVMAMPSRIGVVTSSVSIPGPPLKIQVTVQMGSNTVALGDTVTLDAGFTIDNWGVTAIVSTGTAWVIQLAKFGGVVPLGASTHFLLLRWGGAPPNILVGTVLTGFNVPAASTTIELDPAYTGADGASVWIDDNIYTLSQIAPAGGLVLNLTNLTDTAVGNYDPTEDILSMAELPACRMGVYGLGRNWICLTDGISYMAGDLVGDASGTPLYDYRDAVLKSTENTFLTGGGKFRLPESGNIITSMTFVPTLDTAQGQGPLQVGTDSGFFSNNSPVDRTDWAALTNPDSNPIPDWTWLRGSTLN